MDKKKKRPHGADEEQQQHQREETQAAGFATLRGTPSKRQQTTPSPKGGKGMMEEAEAEEAVRAAALVARRAGPYPVSTA